MGNVLDITLGNVYADLISKIGELTEAITGSFKFSDNAQKYSLGLGLTFKNSTALLKPSIDNLRGSFEGKVATGLEALNTGLQGNVAGMALLVNQQKLTGTAFGNTFKTQSALVSILNLGNERTNQLSLNIIKYGNINQVKTDQLVNAIASLEDTFPLQELAGFGSGFVNAVARLQSDLGPQFAKQVQSISRDILDPSMEAYGRLAQLGIADIRERIARSRSDEETYAIVLEGIQTASRKVGSMVGNAADSYIMLGAAADTFGKGAFAYTSVADALGKRLKNSSNEVVDFGLTLTNLKQEFFSPLIELFQTKLYPSILEIYGVASVLSNKISTSIASYIDTFGGVEGAARAFAQGLTSASILILDSFSLVKTTFKAFQEGYQMPTKGLLDLPDIGKFMFDMFKKMGDDKLGTNMFGSMLKEMENGSFWDKKSEAHLKAINDKTPDLVSGSKYLNETQMLLSESIEKILGIKKDSSIVYLQDIAGNMRDLVDINMQANSKGEPITPPVMGY